MSTDDRVKAAPPLLLHMSQRRPIGWTARCGSLGKNEGITDDAARVNCQACLAQMTPPTKGRTRAR